MPCVGMHRQTCPGWVRRSDRPWMGTHCQSCPARVGTEAPWMGTLGTVSHALHGYAPSDMPWMGTQVRRALDGSQTYHECGMHVAPILGAHTRPPPGAGLHGHHARWTGGRLGPLRDHCRDVGRAYNFIGPRPRLRVHTIARRRPQRHPRAPAHIQRSYRPPQRGEPWRFGGKPKEVVQTGENVKHDCQP